MSVNTVLLLSIAVGVATAAAVRPPTNDLLAPLGSEVKTRTAPAPVSQSSSSDSIVRFKQTSDVDGSYRFAYETDEGTKVEEQGVQKVVDDKQASFVTGGFSYEAPDGTPISLTYVADENGFQPKGDHLPVSPPIPDYILRALQYIKDHPYKE